MNGKKLCENEKKENKEIKNNIDFYVVSIPELFKIALLC
jgi:hypothetical protein